MSPFLLSPPAQRGLDEIWEHIATNASSDAQGKFVQDFAAAWNKVMNLDRFDLRETLSGMRALRYLPEALETPLRRS